MVASETQNIVKPLIRCIPCLGCQTGLSGQNFRVCRR